MTDYVRQDIYLQKDKENQTMTNSVLAAWTEKSDPGKSRLLR